MSLVYYDWWLKCRRVSPLIGPGAAAIEELLASERFAAFGPDTLAEARNRGYHAHHSIRS